jgi:drug/metabolite transporter (DMT)-like permease
MNTTTSVKPTRTLVLLAFAIVYVVWGSTYLGIRVAVGTMPPFLLAAGRFLLAGTAMFIALRLRGISLPDRRQWLHGGIAGILMLLGGNGLVVWAEQTVTSGLSALLVAITPVWFALLEWVRPGGARPAVFTVVGMLVGFGGVALLVTGSSPVGGTVTQDPWGVASLIVAGLCWASGSLWSRYHVKPESPWMNSAVQMMCGGSALLVFSFIEGEPGRFRWAQASAYSWAAFFYLVVFGSLIGFSAYVWLLKVSTPARVATYAYVNPLIAVLLGSWILREPLGWKTGIAAAVILAGVVVTTVGKKA